MARNSTRLLPLGPLVLVMPRMLERLGALRQVKLGLRSHLLIFGLAIVIPVLLYSALLLSRYTQAERTSNERRALNIARSLSADVDREITAIITTLQTMATSTSLATKDFAAFDAQARLSLKSRPWNVVLIDAKQQQLVNTRLPPGTPLPVSALTEPNLLGIAQQTRQPYVTNLFVGTVAKRLIFSVSVPVQVGEEIPYVLAMSLEPERLVEVLNTEALPDGWLAAISDRTNRNMARTRLAERFLGQPIPEESLRQYGSRREGVIATIDFEGQRSLQAFHWSMLTGWRVAAWAPIPLVEAPLREAWLLFLVSGATLLSLSLLLALGVGRLMARPISELMQAGIALGQGKPIASVSSTLREADALSDVLSTAAKELEARMQAQSQLAAIVTASPSAVVSLSPDGIVQTWNAAATELFGYEPSEVIGKPVEMFYSEAALPEFKNINARVRRGETVRADVVRLHKDGHPIDVSISVSPMYDEGDRLVGISAIIRDIGERKERERQIEFLMRELSHRSKNLLAVVQAIAGQTARHSSGIDEFQTRFSQRLHAIAKSQDLLVASDWAGASVDDVIRSQIAPFADAASTRIHMAGPKLQLKPGAVHTLTLALHELATNAAKYGALSMPNGRVDIRWEVDRSTNPGEPIFKMSWQELDGPPVRRPDKVGFGHVVTKEMVASSLHGRVSLEFAHQGLSWTLEAPGVHVLNPG